MNKSTKEIRLPKQQLGLEPKPKLNSSSQTIAKPRVIGSCSKADLQYVTDICSRCGKEFINVIGACSCYECSH